MTTTILVRDEDMGPHATPSDAAAFAAWANARAAKLGLDIEWSTKCGRTPHSHNWEDVADASAAAWDEWCATEHHGDVVFGWLAVRRPGTPFVDVIRRSALFDDWEYAGWTAAAPGAPIDEIIACMTAEQAQAEEEEEEEISYPGHDELGFVGGSAPARDLVVLEYMPECWRASHEAAGNLGRYPHNGSERVVCPREMAEGMVDEWCQIVKADPRRYV